jgi:magnesium-transporting ATPase (P-type)
MHRLIALEFLFEVALVIIACIGALGGKTVAPSTSLILQCIAFGVCALGWLVTIYASRVPAAETPKNRGQSLWLAHFVYFLVAGFLHVFGVIFWSVWLGKYGDLTRPSFSHNTGEKVIELNIFWSQIAMFWVLCVFLVWDVRERQRAILHSR